MSAVLTRAPARSGPSRFCRPRLEALEDRTAPATLTMNLGYTYSKGIVLSGQLTDTPHKAFQTVTITGQVNATTGTDINGNFNATLVANGLGDVNAVASLVGSNTATVTITDQPPVLTSFDAIEVGLHLFTFSGTVTYHRPFESLTIQFGGAPLTLQGKWTQASSTGNFSLTVMLNGYTSDNGTTTAKAISPWGLESNTLLEFVYQTGT